MKLTFIDPINDIELLDYIKIKHTYKHCPVYRFCTVFMYGESIEMIAPLPNIVEILRQINPTSDINSYEFDCAYANQLLTYMPSFECLMLVMNSFQNSEEVFINCNYKHEVLYPIIDSLIKFIQERYGVRAYIVKERSDIDELKTCDFETQEGYRNFLTDYSRYQIMSNKQIEEDIYND